MNYWNKLLSFLGYRYLGNGNTMEIHDLRNFHRNCNIHLISKKNKIRITEKEKNFAIKAGFNGCRWCMKYYDLG